VETREFRGTVLLRIEFFRILLEVGLPANKQRDKALEKMMWDVWLSIERDLNERTPFDFVVELLKSPESSKLLSPVAQFEMALVL
jgi:hypothetical protein